MTTVWEKMQEWMDETIGEAAQDVEKAETQEEFDAAMKILWDRIRDGEFILRTIFRISPDESREKFWFRIYFATASWYVGFRTQAPEALAGTVGTIVQKAMPGE